VVLSSFHKRLLSGLVLAPLTIALILLGGWFFIAFITLGLLVALYEWYGLAVKGTHKYFHLALGALYLLIVYATFLHLRFEFPQGAWLVVCVMIAVWASDIGAYLLGKKIGGPKMAPAISPNKTWAGLIGAMNGAGLVLVFLMFFGYALEPWLHTRIGLIAPDFWKVFLAGFVLGAVGQAGDLLVSVYKRRVGAKDTGALIPGHGGILDRIDALLLAVPAFVIMLHLWFQ